MIKRKAFNAVLKGIASKSYWSYPSTVTANFRVDTEKFNQKREIEIKSYLRKEDNTVKNTVLKEEEPVEKHSQTEKKPTNQGNQTENMFFSESDSVKLHSDKAVFVGRESKVAASTFSRSLKFANLGLGIVGRGVSGMVRDSVTASRDNKSFASYLITEKTGERLSMTLCKLRGAALKFGQILSSFEDVIIPAPIREALEKSRKEAEIMPKKQLNSVLAKNLGSDWESKFKHFDRSPFAAASIGQVHSANLLDGRKVAVKVQYPGVATSIGSDIAAIKNIFSSF